MPKTKISEFSATPANNTDIDSINIAEGCAPSGINDAIRELMAQLKDFQTGAVGDSFNGPVGATTPASGAFTTLSASSTVTLSGGTANGVLYLNGSKVVTSGSALTFDGTNLGLSGAGSRFINLGSTSTNGQSVALQISAPNSDASANVYRVGTGLTADNEWVVYDVTNTQTVDKYIRGSSGYRAFYQNGSEAMRLTSTGLGIGTSSPVEKVQSSKGIAATGANQSVGSLDGFVADYSSGASRLFASRNGVAASTLEFWTTDSGGAANKRTTLDSSGNLGLGVTPSAWGSSYKAFDVASIGASFAGSSYGSYVTSNAYNNETNWIYKAGTYGAGYYTQFNGSHAWYSAPSGTAGNAITFTQAMTLDASGNLLVGTTSPTYSASGRGLVEVNGSSTSLLALKTGGSAAGYLYHDGTALSLVNTKASYIQFTTNGIDAARIDSGGNLQVGTTSRLQSDNRVSIQGPASNGGEAVVTIYNTVSSTSGDASPALVCSKDSVTTTSSQRFIQFYAGGVSTTPMGGIVGNGASNVQFATLSDAREKTNIQLINGSLEKIVALKPVEFDWILNGEHCPAGFVAQDVEQVFPEFVIENMANEGQESRKGLTGGMTGGIIPHLVKAIQEQQAIIESLKARLDAANL